MFCKRQLELQFPVPEDKNWVIEHLDEREIHNGHSHACWENMEYHQRMRREGGIPTSWNVVSTPYSEIKEGCRCSANGDRWTRISDACWRTNWPNPWNMMIPGTLNNCLKYLQKAPHHNTDYRIRNIKTQETIPACGIGY